MVTCKFCGAENSSEATFCRVCGNALNGYADTSKKCTKKDKSAWILFCQGLSIIMIIYGLFAFATLHSEVYSQNYNGNGHNDYVVTQHNDALGLIKSVGYGYSMTEGTSLESIIADSMDNGKESYYFACFALVIIGGVIGGISSLIYRKKLKKEV